MSHLQRTREAIEAASQRRAHLITRGLLDGLAHLAERVAVAAERLRSRLDARGGAHHVVLEKGSAITS